MADHSSKLLNHALELAIEWGENFRQPIHPRIRVKYPNLTDADIDELIDIARRAEQHILTLRPDDGSDSLSRWATVRLARREFPWLSRSNIHRIRNIGMYWANR